MTSLLLSLLLAAAAGMQQPLPEPALAGDIARVRELYALASYEEALARLDAAGANVEPRDAAQYRALCLIGLSRVVEAEQTMERFVIDYPEYAMTESDVSPRLVTMYREARQRVVPATARARYSEAKSAFDRQQFTRAARAFREVTTLLSDEELVGQTPGLHDLKLLAEGFLGLAEGEIEKAERAAAAPAPAPAPAAPETTVAATPAPAAPMPAAAAPVAAAPAPAAVNTTTESAPKLPSAIYSEQDATVVAPVEVNRRLPLWNPPPVMARMEFRGLLEVVIDEQGAVAAASLVKPVHPQYDSPLLDATARWRFQPATRDGQPVAYRKTFEIVLGRR